MPISEGSSIPAVDVQIMGATGPETIARISQLDAANDSNPPANGVSIKEISEPTQNSPKIERSIIRGYGN